ncbi:MAG: hypothetical protein DRN20_03395 [Thermoplasmata archaeon]|nr:MAG: hypothetical protein DRN20_03395 [Thermoplasmata archaeon]
MMAKEEDIITVLDIISKRRLRKVLRSLGTTGRRSDILTVAGRGRYVKYRMPEGEAKDIAIIPTVLAAAMRSRGKKKIRIKKEDIREKIRRKKSAGLICIIFDASSSMLGGWRAATAKSIVYDMLVDIYQKRDKVALITISDNRAELSVRFTSDIERIRHAIEGVRYGGTTPLAHAIVMGGDVLKKRAQIERGSIPILVVITDGEANVSMSGGEVLKDLKNAMKNVVEYGIIPVIIEVGGQGLRKIAEDCGWQYMSALKEDIGYEFVDQSIVNAVLDSFALATINKECGGILVIGAKQNQVDLAVENCKNVGFEIECVKDCIYNCDPDGDNLCLECSIRKNYGLEMERRIAPLPIIRLEPWDEREMLGRIYLRYMAVRGMLSRAHRGFLYVPDIKDVDDKTWNIISSVIKTRRITLESNLDGENVSITYPCDIRLIARADNWGDVPNEIVEHFDFLINTRGEYFLHRDIRILRERREWERDPEEYARGIERKIRSTLLAIIMGREKIEEIESASVENMAERVLSRISSYGFSVDDGVRKRIRRVCRAILALGVDEKDAEKIAIDMAYRALSTRYVHEELPRDAVFRSALTISLLPIINSNIKGVILTGLEEIVPSILGVLKESGYSTLFSKGCVFNCNPNDYEKLCLECSLKMEYGELSADVRRIPVVSVDCSNVSREELFGHVYLKFIAKIGLLARANGGVLCLKRAEDLDESIAIDVVNAIESGRNVLERGGIIISHPIWFALLVSTKSGERISSAFITARTLLYNGKYVVRGIEDTDAEKIAHRIREARKVLGAISVPGEEIDFIVRCCEHYGVEDNGVEYLVMETARTLAALRGKRKVDAEDTNDALVLVLDKFLEKKGMYDAEKEYAYSKITAHEALGG